MNGLVEKVSALVHSSPLEGWQAQPNGVVVSCLNNVIYMGRGGLICPPYGTVLHKPNRLRHLVLVTINEMNEWISCARTARPDGLRHLKARGGWSRADTQCWFRQLFVRMGI